MALFVNDQQLASLFPAYLRLDSEGIICAVGPSLERHCPELLPGRSFFEAFAIERPLNMKSIRDVVAYQRVLIVQCRDRPLVRLRGSVVHQEDVFLLLGHIPAVEEHHDAPQLRVADFSPSDGALDALLAAQIRQGLLDDATNLAAQLRRKTEEAEAATAAKTTFLANMSHELRTPMNTVLGIAAVLQRGALDEKQRRYVDMISEAGDGLLHILNDILDLTKVEAGKVELEEVTFNLEDIINPVGAAFTLKADEKGLAFGLTVDAEARGVFLGDPTRIRQVLTNLVSNAVKFTEAGEVRVHVFAEENAALARDQGHDGDWPTLVFSVTDTGPGLTQEALGRLFQHFTQADETITRRHGGAGLGLSISKQLATLMGGDVTVDSAPGAGSVFRFTVRLQRTAGADASYAPNEAEDPFMTAATQAGDDIDNRRLRVLVADDNVRNREVVDALLEPLNPEIVFAENGQEAVDAWARATFDVILMDVQMPVMNGVDATRAIRCQEAEKGCVATPILALTANVMRHQIDEYLAAGMDDVVSKPIKLGELFTALQNLLSPESTEADSSQAEADIA